MMEYCLPHTIFEIAQWAATAHNNRREPKNVLQVWQERLETDNERLVIKFCFLLSLANDHAIELISNTDLSSDSKTTYTKAINSLNRLIKVQSMDLNWLETKENCLKPETVSDLRGMRDAIRKEYVLETLDNDRIEKLQDEIAKAINLIIDQIDDILLRKYLSEELEFLNFCLTHFDLIGSFGLEDSVGKIVQKCLANQEHLPKDIRKRLQNVAMAGLTILIAYGGIRCGFDYAIDDFDRAKKEVAKLEQAEVGERKLLEHRPTKKSNAKKDNKI